jgi:hypothetical protein
MERRLPRILVPVRTLSCQSRHRNKESTAEEKFRIFKAIREEGLAKRRISDRRDVELNGPPLISPLSLDTIEAGPDAIMASYFKALD